MSNLSEKLISEELETAIHSLVVRIKALHLTNDQTNDLVKLVMASHRACHKEAYLQGYDAGIRQILREYDFI